ncbi:MAG: caspase family protein [Bacteroidetes bacterium]|nr:caspase family protein [Bacteroidota bacterium]
MKIFKIYNSIYFFGMKLSAVIIIFPMLLFPGTFYAQEPELILPIGHTQDIYSTQQIDSGKYIITIAYDNTVKLWDAASGHLLHTFQGLVQSPEHVQNTGNTTQVTTDGKFLFALTADGYVKKWELPSAKPVFSIRASGILVEYSSDGKYFLVTKCGNNNETDAEVRDASDGKLIYTFRKKKQEWFADRDFQFSPAGNYILISRDSSLFLHQSSNGKLVMQLEQIPDFASFSFSPDGKYLAIFPQNSNLLRLWKMSDGTVGKMAVSGKIEFSPDSKYILSTDRKKLYLINVSSGESVTLSNGEISQSMLGHFSDDGKYIFLTRNEYFDFGNRSDSITTVWETENHRLLFSLNGGGYTINSVVFSPDNKYIASVSEKTRIWETSSGNPVRSFEGRQLLFSADSKSISIIEKNGISIFNIGSGELFSRLQGHSKSITKAVFSNDSSWLITLSNENIAKLWNLSKGRIEKTFEEKSIIKDVAFSAGGENILLLSKEGIARVMSISTGEEIFTLAKKGINSAGFSPDGQRIITTSDSSLCTWNAETGKLLLTIKERYPVSEASMSSDGNFAYYIFGGSALAVINFTNGAIWRDYFNEEEISEAEFSADSRSIYVLGENGTSKLYNNTTGEITRQLSERSESEHAISYMGGYYYENLWQPGFRHFSPDGKYLATRTYFDYFLVVRKTDNLSITDTVHLNEGLINDAAFISETDELITGSGDDTIRIWNKGKKGFKVTGKFSGNGFIISPGGKWLLIINNSQLVFYDLNSRQLQFNILPVDESGYFTQLRGQPYYSASKNAAEELSFRLGEHFFSFEQFDLRLNRPDIILEGIDKRDTSLISAYHRAYLKRLRKLGIDTTSFSARLSIPESTVTSDADYDQRREKVKIRIRASDINYNIDRFNVWVNDCPLWGQKGINLRNRNRNNLDTTIEITLSDGSNRIEASIMNINGVESYRSPLYLNYFPLKASPSNTFFIGIGIDQFVDSEYNLTWSSKDIRDMCGGLKKKYGNNLISDTLFNKQVTLENVCALKKILLNTTVNDRVIIAYSGHGLLNSNFDYFLSTYNVNFNKPEDGGLPYEELENLLDSIPARMKLLMIDACHSGEVDKEEVERIDLIARDSTLRLFVSKGVHVTNNESSSDFYRENTFDLMNDLFVNVSRGTGATVIAASSGTQFALENNDIENGVFTFCFLQLLDSRGSCSVSNLKNNISNEVERRTKGMQKPTSRSETIDFDWKVW